MSFRPSIHGWPFRNVEGPEAHLLGLGTLPPGVLGGGLCWAALDRYLRGVGIPRDTPRPEPGDPLHAELVRRQVAALSGVWSRVDEWQARPDGSWRDRLPFRLSGGRDLASLTRSEWPLIQSRLNDDEPILLTLLCKADGYRHGRAIRQVLATGWTIEDVRVVISVYDPGCPSEDGMRLSFGATGPLDARLSDGLAVRGFMATPYDRSVPAPLRAETFADRSVVGLDRPVRGRLDAASGRRRIDLVGRNAAGALIHFWRSRGQSWEGANVTELEDLGSYELHSDPAVVRSAGLHVFALSYVGDLLQFRLGRSRRVENLTDQKRTGAGFRLVGQPIALAGPRGRISVLGRDKEGGLLHYTGYPLLGWRAERVAGDPLSGDPVAAWAGSTLHVAATVGDGRIVHRKWDGDGWSVSDAAALAIDGLAAHAAGRLVLGVAGDAVHIAGRSRDGRLLVLTRTADGSWESRELGHGVVGDPVLASGPAGVHVFARTDDGDLLHAWHADEWCSEEVLATRSSLPALPPARALTCWGSADELRVWGSTKDDLWMLVWRSDADWVLERLSERAGVAARHRPADPPVVIEDGQGFPHLFATDGHGTVVHLEAGEWREPGAPGAAVAERHPQPEPEPQPELEPEAQSPPEPEPEARSEPAADIEPQTMDLEPGGVEPESPEPGTPEPEVAWAAAPVEEPEAETAEGEEPWAAAPVEDPEAEAPEPEEPWATAPVDDPEAEAPEPEEPWTAAPVTDPEAEAPEPEEPWATAAVDEPETKSPQPERRWPEDREPVGTEPDPPDPSPSAEVEGEEGEEGERSEPLIEPMDLTLLEDWPPAPPSRRKREKREKEKS